MHACKHKYFIIVIIVIYVVFIIVITIEEVLADSLFETCECTGAQTM